MMEYKSEEELTLVDIITRLEQRVTTLETQFLHLQTKEKPLTSGDMSAISENVGKQIAQQIRLKTGVR